MVRSISISSRRSLLVLLIGVLAGPAYAGITHRPEVSVLLSTGQTLRGEITRDDGRVLTLSQAKPRARHEVVGRNILTMTFHVFPDAMLKDPDAETKPFLAMGRFAADRRWPWLAEHLLLMSHVQVQSGEAAVLNMHDIERRLEEEDPQGLDAVHAVYEASRLELPASLGGEADQAPPPRRYELATVEQVEANLEQAQRWFEQAQGFAPDLHVIETDHFTIYSTWPRSDDKALVQIYQRMYAKVCEQFDVPQGEHVWIGRLPVFAFWNQDEFVRFCVEVCEIPQEMADQAGGFATARGQFDAVVLGPVVKPGMSRQRAKDWFFNLLVHESTHAFLARYISREHVPSWLNEGLAETIASELVPNTDSDFKLRHAHAAIQAGGLPDPGMFTARNIPLDALHYGSAQSITRFLIAKDRKGYLELIRNIKAGTSDTQALQTHFGLTTQELMEQWSTRVAGGRR